MGPPQEGRSWRTKGTEGVPLTPDPLNCRSYYFEEECLGSSWKTATPGLAVTFKRIILYNTVECNHDFRFSSHIEIEMEVEYLTSPSTHLYSLFLREQIC
jgi:hypothetical protein